MKSHPPAIPFAGIRPDGWTVIATRDRKSHDGHWYEAEGAPLPLRKAMAAEADGEIIAQRHEPLVSYLVHRRRGS